MKQIIIILCLLFLSAPAFATAGWYEGCNDNPVVVPISEARQFFQTRDINDHRPVIIDDGGAIHAYYRKLVEAYDKKYPCYIDENGASHSYAPFGSWNREVIIPLYRYLGELQMKYQVPDMYEQYSPAQLQKNKEDARKLRREKDLEKWTIPLKKLKLIPN